MTTVTNAVAKRDTGPTALMWSRRKRFEMVLPASVDVEAFLGTAAGALFASKSLMDNATANPDSLMIALMECAALGHMPGTDEYYLTPRKDKGRPKVLGIEGYRGVIERMYRSGAVAKVVVREVCANDKFHYVEGEMDIPEHEFGGRGGTGSSFFAAMGKRGEMVGGYAYAQFTTGAYSRVVLLTRDDVFAARDAGGYKPADEYSPWNRMDGGQDHPEFQGRSMWWKTLAKRLEPWVPTSAEYRREQLRASAGAANAAVRNPSAVTADPEPVDAEIVEDTPEITAPPAPERPAQQHQPRGNLAGLIVQHFERLGVEERNDRLIATAQVLRLDEIPESTNALAPEKQKELLGKLEKCRDADALGKLTAVTDGEATGA